MVAAKVMAWEFRQPSTLDLDIAIQSDKLCSVSSQSNVGPRAKRSLPAGIVR